MMRKICEMLRKNDVGAIGIGAMIVFIAMVLVAGIAASVLIQTSTRLEAQALATGSETTEEVAGGIAIDDISGHVATDIDMLAITVRVRAGSPDIDLNYTAIELSEGTTKVILHFDHTDPWHFNTSLKDNADVFDTGSIANLTYEEFGIIVLEDADSSVSRSNPVINRGDRVVLTIDSSACFPANGIDERTDVFGLVLPEIGSAGVIAFTTPSSYAETVIDLQ